MLKHPFPNKPTFIDKRVFTCKDCGYSVQVHGESYFDFGCYNYIGTMECLECRTLYETVITKRNWKMLGFLQPEMQLFLMIPKK